MIGEKENQIKNFLKNCMCLGFLRKGEIIVLFQNNYYDLKNILGFLVFFSYIKGGFEFWIFCKEIVL